MQHDVPVTAQPAGGTLSGESSGTTQTNEGATSLSLFTLPGAAAGRVFSFVVQDSDGIRVNAAEGDTIRVGRNVSSTAGRIDCLDMGSVITLVAINSTEWIATSMVGTWVVI